MNLIQHRHLWTNIQQFAFDEPGATITFSKKLAAQQKWPATYTERVIEEYRRFIFLCCISPKGASPSKAVDEVWHLHLTYTQSYWNAFCKNTLGKDVHHYPSTGGTREDHKHADWYGETLRLYESVFDEKPPADIWPQPVEASGSVSLRQPVDVSWSTYKEQYRIGKDMWIKVGVLCLLPFVSSYIINGIASPFSLKGPQFLLFYAILVFTSLIAFYLLRKDRLAFMKEAMNAWSPKDMSVFQLAHSVYGKDRAIETCLIDLYRRGLVSVNEINRKIVVHRNNYQAPVKEENPLMKRLLIKADNSTIDYDTITNDWYKQADFEHPAIEQLHSLIDHNKSLFEEYVVLIIALFIGLARVVQGVSNDRPVAFIVLEILVFVVVAVIVKQKSSTNKWVYDKLEALILEKGGNKRLHADEVVNDYAINGQGVLDVLPASLMLGSMFMLFPVTTMRRRPTSNGDTDNSDINPVVDSSCSGGSSCSSGGDSSCGSGSGCGGCGGGGGD